MKERKHQTDTYEAVVEQLEQIIENIDPNAKVLVSDITGQIKLTGRNSEITKATIMLLKKYGIEYKEETNGRSNRGAS
jgi:hypothetical protein